MLRDGEPCSHRGCLNHISHPCEGCGRIRGKNIKMKEYKFRAWEPLNKEMIYFDGFIPFKISDKFIEGALSSQNQEKRYLTVMNYDAIELMQFAGVDDSRGLEVYEDDILEIWIDGIKQDNYYIVEDSRELYLEMNRDDSYYRISKIKVVGNKWENPELA